MKDKGIDHIYKSRFKKISKYYQDLPDNFNENDLHYFRIEIKKLRAFIRLTNLLRPGQEQKIPKAIKKFYNRVGDIRNLQLHQQRINSLSSSLSIECPACYLNYLHEEEKAIKEKARKIAKRISLKNFEKELVDESSGKLTEEARNEFVQKSRRRLGQLLMLPFYYDETMHDIRKTIKDLMYNYKYLEPAVSSMNLPSLSDVNAMDTITTELGDFHDLCLALIFLGPDYVIQIAEVDETAIINKLRYHLQLRKEDLRNEILKSLAPVKQQQLEMEKAYSCLS